MLIPDEGVVSKKRRLWHGERGGKATEYTPPPPANVPTERPHHPWLHSTLTAIPDPPPPE